MDRPDPKQDLFDGFAKIGRVVSNPRRIELLELLSQGEKPVELLARQASLSISNTSNHLKELRAASLVCTRREGTHVYYRLADPVVHGFLRSLQSLAQRQLAEVRQIVRDYYEAPDSLEPVAAVDLQERIQREEVLVLDVRPADEFVAAHIPGAVSVPVDELERRLSSLPADREIIAYCRGPYCVYSLRALELLRSRGYRARRLREGIPDWKARGLPVALGPEKLAG